MKTVHCHNRLQRQQWGDYATSMPATWYFTFHALNALVGAVIATDTTVVLANPPSEGAAIILEPGAVAEETRTVLSVTGGGPYVVTVAALSNPHADGAAVLADPGFTADAVTEPSGGSFARAAHTNNSTNYGDAASSQSSNLTVITWPLLTGDLGDYTHVLAYDAATLGICWEWWRLSTAITLADGDTPKVNVGQLLSLLRGVTA